MCGTRVVSKVTHIHVLQDPQMRPTMQHIVALLSDTLKSIETADKQAAGLETASSQQVVLMDMDEDELENFILQNDMQFTQSGESAGEIFCHMSGVVHLLRFAIDTH
jgi:hypothetical protein